MENKQPKQNKVRTFRLIDSIAYTFFMGFTLWVIFYHYRFSAGTVYDALLILIIGTISRLTLYMAMVERERSKVEEAIKENIKQKDYIG